MTPRHPRQRSLRIFFSIMYNGPLTSAMSKTKKLITCPQLRVKFYRALESITHITNSYTVKEAK